MLNAASEEPEAEAGAILVENVIKVKAGFGEAVLERFAKPKQVHTFKGFIRMDVLHGKAADGDEEIRVCTTWESKADFEAWASSDSFRGAHSRRDGESGGGEQAPANGPSHGQAQGHAHGQSHGQAQGHAHGQSHGQGGALGSAAQGPVIGNKVTIYRVAASHLPASAAADASV
ncbi:MULTISPECIES: antibiotic biosynthesis monooxygenase [Paenibacillus]|uniref:antibiotic biosynthesis monooxygenase n=1 Tax=Paenibacillus TaxID=44249 RepID=UPI001E584280|nr:MULTISPECIES: antibiotic biosynthesis monooxygenase [Paenibacillus]